MLYTFYAERLPLYLRKPEVKVNSLMSEVWAEAVRPDRENMDMQKVTELMDAGKGAVAFRVKRHDDQ